jgi:hypothetical protein
MLQRYIRRECDVMLVKTDIVCFYVRERADTQ